MGETHNGDATLIREEPGATMVVVVDALGHGPIAEDVAKKALAFLSSAPLDAPAKLLERLDRELHGTRGAAATLCVFDQRTLAGCGVGNVEVRTRGGSLSAVLSPGVLGVSVRRFKTFEAKLMAGTRMVLFSDGVSSRFEIPSPLDVSAEAACDRILDGHRRATDDASVLIVDTVL